LRQAEAKVALSKQHALERQEAEAQLSADAIAQKKAQGALAGKRELNAAAAAVSARAAEAKLAADASPAKQQRALEAERRLAGKKRELAQRDKLAADALAAKQQRALEESQFRKRPVPVFSALDV